MSAVYCWLIEKLALSIITLLILVGPTLGAILLHISCISLKIREWPKHFNLFTSSERKD
jgi:hypothetical protein